MRIKSIILVIGLALLGSFTAVNTNAQTNALPPLPPIPGNPIGQALSQLDNIDTNATIISAEKMEVRIGAVSEGISGASFDSLLGVSYYFHENFGVAGEVINGNVGGGVESSHLLLELRKPLGNACATAFMGLGRNFDADTWEGTAGLRISYVPAPQTTRMGGFAESRLVVTESDVKKPSSQFVVGIFYPF